MKEKVINIALLGLGTVGMGVYKLITKNKDNYYAKTGRELIIRKILVRDINKPREVEENLLTNEWDEIIKDSEIDIVVEVMGGIEPARSYITEALKARKNVVTANKDLLAEYGRELLMLAQENEVDLVYEASVAGGIPIIRPLKQCLAGNNIEQILGIINGTTNFILTKMTLEKANFPDVLKEAQDLGYAEADPTSDIEGYDAARKLAIMASIAFNMRITFKNIYVEGITKVVTNDILYAQELGYVIKLIALAKETEGGIEARVHPTLIPEKHPLATVNDSFNAVFVKGDAVGEAMFYGPGAGQLPTASAILGDIIDVTRNIMNNCTGRINCTCYRNAHIKPFDEINSKYYLRLQVVDKPGVMASITSVFGDYEVSLASIIQKHRYDNNKAEVVVITDQVQEKNMSDAIKILSQLEMVLEVSSVIRVEDI